MKLPVRTRSELPHDVPAGSLILVEDEMKTYRRDTDEWVAVTPVDDTVMLGEFLTNRKITFMAPKEMESLRIDATCSHRECQGAGTYTLSGQCMNCGTKQIIGTFSRGHIASDRSYHCPNCDCNQMYWNRP